MRLAAGQRPLAARGGNFVIAAVGRFDLAPLVAVGPDRSHIGQALAGAAFLFVAAAFFLALACQGSAGAGHGAELLLRVLLLSVALDLVSQSLQGGRSSAARFSLEHVGW